MVVKAGLVGGAFALSLAMLSGVAQAAPNLVVNGDFESVSGTLVVNGTTTSGEIYGSVSGGTTDLPSWTTTSRVAVLYTPGTADTSGANGNAGGQGNGVVRLWGTNDGGTTAIPASSPTGGNFLAMDGDPTYSGTLSQTINGLVVGGSYQLTYQMAAGQENGNNGNTTEAFSVSLGSQTQQSETLNNPSHGFTPWRTETMTFVATATSEVLSFLAVGTPSGEPPMSLLDGVSLVQTPEPATWLVLTAGLVGMAAFSYRRRKAAGPGASFDAA